ncbi:hypothetical protein SRRS_05220 [Sporomusa rhizae]|uniref:hypothetical protein n=1 Tax=Sporomusa rhizae TaxID=357999 RepID=UPI00352B2F8A
MMKILSTAWKDAVGSKIIANYIWETRSIWGAFLISTIGTFALSWLQNNWYIPMGILSVIVIYLLVRLYRKDEEIRSLDEKLQEATQELINHREQIMSKPITDVEWLKNQNLTNYYGLFWFVIHNKVCGVKTEFDFVEENPQFRKLLNNNVLTKIKNHGYEISPETFDYLKDEFEKMGEEKRKIIKFELDGDFGFSYLHHNIC